MISENALAVRSGEVVTDEQGRLNPAFTRKWNELVRAVAALGRPSGKGIRKRELPDQTLISVDIRREAREDVAFRVRAAAGESAEEFLVTVGFGTLDGIEPTIDGKRITEGADAGDEPALKVFSRDFGRDSRCRLYLRVQCSASWRVEKVEVVAKAELPPAEPRVAWKLLALLVKDAGGAVRVVQAAKRSLGFAAYERRPDGRFRAVFWAES